MKKQTRIVLIGLAALLLLAGLAAVVMWQTIRPRDPIFRGQRESEWIAQLVYRDEAQVEQWRKFGPEGTRVLIRALEGADRPMDRAYRRFYRDMLRLLPGRLAAGLPLPRDDLTRATRMNIVYLLSRLSKDAKEATPVMVKSLKDEHAGVGMLAIIYFIRNEDDHVLLTELPPKTKRDLLPEFIRLAQSKDAGSRNNATVALRYYPEQAQVVVPVLTKLLQDSDANVRRIATNSLKKVDPVAAAKAGIK